MIEIKLQELLQKTGSLFKLVNLASKRALQLNEGALPLVAGDNPRVKLAAVALEEILTGKITYKQ